MDVSQYLNQDEIWYTTDQKQIKVSEMAGDHAALCARWLQQNATGLILVVEASKNEGALAGDGDVTDVLSLIAQSPRQWMSNTPLYQALIKASGGEDPMGNGRRFPKERVVGTGGPGNYSGRKERFN